MSRPHKIRVYGSVLPEKQEEWTSRRAYAAEHSYLGVRCTSMPSIQLSSTRPGFGRPWYSVVYFTAIVVVTFPFGPSLLA